jgi:hypothetical protein
MGDLIQHITPVLPTGPRPDAAKLPDFEGDRNGNLQ